jgi:hypothetical protein
VAAEGDSALPRRLPSLPSRIASRRSRGIGPDTAAPITDVEQGAGFPKPKGHLALNLVPAPVRGDGQDLVPGADQQRCEPPVKPGVRPGPGWAAAVFPVHPHADVDVPGVAEVYHFAGGRVDDAVDTHDRRGSALPPGSHVGDLLRELHIGPGRDWLSMRRAPVVDNIPGRQRLQSRVLHLGRGLRLQVHRGRHRVGCRPDAWPTRPRPTREGS